MNPFALTALLAVAAMPTLALASGDATLRAECAAKHGVDVKPAAANEHVFVYHQGKLRGEVQPGQSLPCSEGQYSAYLARLDPAHVLAANPTAAGKPAVEEHVFTYKKGVLKQQGQ